MIDNDTPLGSAKLRNVGPATLADFKVLGIATLGELARQDADRLYLRLCEETARRHDPCVHDVFAAAIHQARTGESVDWWTYSAARKLRQAAGDFPQPAAGTRRSSRSSAGEEEPARRLADFE
jgi:nucleotidyltransferase/DNA polymerase involved in DNA repair